MKKNLLKTICITSALAVSLMGCGNDSEPKKKANSSSNFFDSLVQEETTKNNSLNDLFGDDSIEDSYNDVDSEPQEEPLVYFLNKNNDKDSEWKELAKRYTEETGIKVIVVTASSGTYETTLASEIMKDEAPTLFQVSGAANLDVWKDFCYDLSKSDVYKELSSDSYALKIDNKVLAIPYCIETYGIIVNKTLLSQAGYNVDDITSFAKLKEIAEDITARSSELGFSAFTPAGMDLSSDWRFKTHLANLPLHFEFLADGISTSTTIRGTYLDNYRQIFDLYINNSACDPAMLATTSIDASRNEFLAHKAVFYQNGSWEYGSLNDTFKDEELAMIPIYIGAGNEANQGLCTGSENFWCVNIESSSEDIQATLDFLYWVVTSEEGTSCLSEDMRYSIPFKEAPKSTNLFINQNNDYVAKGKIPVSWNFNSMPTEFWKNDLGSALIAYAANQTDANWDAVVKAFVDGWKREYELLGY